MDIRPILTDRDLDDAPREIERLWGSPLGTSEGDKLSVLTTLVGAYEDEHFPVEPSSSLEMLRYAVGDMGRTQTELAEVVGSRALASQLLSGKRRISLDAAQKISAHGISPSSCSWRLIGRQRRRDTPPTPA